MTASKVTVLGGGSFGTALANIAAENRAPATSGNDADSAGAVMLWLRDQAIAKEINHLRVNSQYMPGYPLHPKLVATTNIEEAVQGADLIIVSVPSSAFRQVVRTIVPLLEPGQALISSAKGVEKDGFCLMSQVLQQEAPAQPQGVLSGPNLAKEIAKHMLTATVIASEDASLRQEVQRRLANSYFRVYASEDVHGVELGGVLKNIYAIISGLAVALGMGENTRAMLMTRSLAEMSRFAVSMGANPMTFIGLAGVGDLIVTCNSPLSRNYRVGYALGKGESLEDAVKKLGEVAEGVNTLRLVKEKADELGIYMPLASVLFDVLYNGLSINKAIQLLMTSEQSNDVEFVLPRRDPEPVTSNNIT